VFFFFFFKHLKNFIQIFSLKETIKKTLKYSELIENGNVSPKADNVQSKSSLTNRMMMTSPLFLGLRF